MPYPQFDDADIEIRLDAKNEPWRLHSWVLALHSPWFKASLSERWSGAPGTRRRYELRFNTGESEGFLTSDLNTATELAADPGGWPDCPDKWRGGPKEGANEEQMLYLRRITTAVAHEAMLDALYHIAAETTSAWTDDLREDYLLALKVADYYSCLPIVALRVEHSLRSKSGEWLFRDCRDKPFQMAELESIDLKLLRLRPVGLEDSIASQLALNVFRDRLTRDLNAGLGSDMEPGYARPYRRIASGVLGAYEMYGPDHCLLPEQFEYIRGPFKLALHTIIAHAKATVDSLLLYSTQLKTSHSQTDNLLCTEIWDHELPWNHEYEDDGLVVTTYGPPQPPKV